MPSRPERTWVQLKGMAHILTKRPFSLVSIPEFGGKSETDFSCWLQSYQPVGPSPLAPRPAPPPQYIVGNQLMVPQGKRRGRPPKQQVVVPTPDQLKYRTADTSSLAAMGAAGGITISPGQLITSSGPSIPAIGATHGTGPQPTRAASPGGTVGLIGGPPPLGATNGASLLPQRPQAAPIGPSRLSGQQQGLQAPTGTAASSAAVPASAQANLGTNVGVPAPPSAHPVSVPMPPSSGMQAELSWIHAWAGLCWCARKSPLMLSAHGT